MEAVHDKTATNFMLEETEQTKRYKRRYQAIKYKRIMSLIKELLGGKCVACGATEQLEIDHINMAEKEFDMTKAMTYSRKKVLEEMAKCQLLCKSCHLEKTKRDNPKTVDHGGGLTGKRNCRCELCAPLKNKYNKKYR